MPVAQPRLSQTIERFQGASSPRVRARPQVRGAASPRARTAGATATRGPPRAALRRAHSDEIGQSHRAAQKPISKNHTQHTRRVWPQALLRSDAGNATRLKHANRRAARKRGLREFGARERCRAATSATATAARATAAVARALPVCQDRCTVSTNRDDARGSGRRPVARHAQLPSHMHPHSTVPARRTGQSEGQGERNARVNCRTDSVAASPLIRSTSITSSSALTSGWVTRRRATCVSSRKLGTAVAITISRDICTRACSVSSDA